MMIMNRVAITGLSMIDTLGNNPEDCIGNYLEGEYREPIYSEEYEVKKSFLVPEYMIPSQDLIRRSTYHNFDKVNKIALFCVGEALSQVPKSDNVFNIFSTLSGGERGVFEHVSDVTQGTNLLKPKKLLQGLRDFAAGMTSTAFNLRGGSTSFNSACATSLYSLDYAMRLVDEYDYVVCGAADTGTVRSSMFFFDKIGALGTHSAPFDKNRDGFIMGEGGACFILESEEKAKARGAKIWGYLHKPGLSTDGDQGNPVSPSDVGILVSMEKSLKGIDKNNIAFVNAHATSTPAGDEIEYEAIQKIIPSTPVVGFKSKIGHTMGASSIVEIAYTLMCLREGVIPTNHNVNDCDLRMVTRETYKTKKTMALKNSLAFGGKCASIVVETPEV
jgi:3-oxoacyl-[acyl-carrier-protein] synthase II